MHKKKMISFVAIASGSFLGVRVWQVFCQGKSQAAVAAQHGSWQLHSSSFWNPQSAQSVGPSHMIPQESIPNTEGHKEFWGQGTMMKYLCGYMFWLSNGSYLQPCCTWLMLPAIIIYILYWRMAREHKGLLDEKAVKFATTILKRTELSNWYFLKNAPVISRSLNKAICQHLLKGNTENSSLEGNVYQFNPANINLKIPRKTHIVPMETYEHE